MAETKINGINGWYFTRAELNDANSQNRLLTIDFEFGDNCFLNCKYCYRSGDTRNESGGLLSLNSWKQIINEAKTLGVKSVKMIGGGEITEEDDFIDAMEYIAKSNIVIVLFTSGSTLGNNRRCQRILGMSSQSLAKWMYDIGMTVFLKFDSFIPGLQDELAGFKGYTSIRDKALELLLTMNFTHHNPTRLGLEVNVNRFNYQEILKIYSLRAKYNIYEDVVLSMPCDAYFRNKEYDITLFQKRELYKQIYWYNKLNNIPFDDISPFIGGMTCTQLGNGLYITNRGQVFHCPGSFIKIGDLMKESLVDIWLNFRERNKYFDNYFCPFREASGIIPSSLVDEIRKEFSEEICK